MVIRQVGAVQTDAGRGVGAQIKSRNGVYTRRIHRRSGIKSVVSPIVRKRREEHGQRSDSNCEDPEPHLVVGQTKRDPRRGMNTQFTSFIVLT